MCAGCYRPIYKEMTKLLWPYPKVARSWEVFTILVERHRHDPVGRIESLLDSVTMMYVDVNVQHPLMISGITNYNEPLQIRNNLRYQTWSSLQYGWWINGGGLLTWAVQVLPGQCRWHNRSQTPQTSLHGAGHPTNWRQSRLPACSASQHQLWWYQ